MPILFEIEMALDWKSLSPKHPHMVDRYSVIFANLKLVVLQK